MQRNRIPNIGTIFLAISAIPALFSSASAALIPSSCTIVVLDVDRKRNAAHFVRQTGGTALDPKRSKPRLLTWPKPGIGTVK